MVNIDRQISKELAVDIIDSLGETGQPPFFGTSLYSVGLEKHIQIIEEEYLNDRIANGHSMIKIVLEAKKKKKTHFLRLVQECAWKNGYVVSFNELNDSTNLSSLKDIFQSIMRNLYIPPGNYNTDAESLRGFETILNTWVEKTLSQMKSMEDVTSIRRYLQQFGANMDEDVQTRVKISDYSFRKMLVRYFQYHYNTVHNPKYDKSNDPSTRKELLKFFHGEATYFDQLKYRRKFGIGEVVNERNFLPMFVSLIDFLKHIGFRGLVLIFDEAEVSFPEKKRKAEKMFIKNLLMLTNEIGTCGINNLFLLYASTDAFKHKIPDLGPAIKTRLIPFSEEGIKLANYYSPRIFLRKMDISWDKWKEQVAEKVSLLYAISKDLPENYKELIVELSNVYDDFEPSKRRKFVKSLIQAFNSGEVNGYY